MAKFCGNCGSPLNDTAVFCGGCGARVPASPAPVISQAPVVAPSPVAPSAASLPAAAPFTPVTTSTPAPAFTPVSAAPAFTPAPANPAFTPVPAAAAFTPVPAYVAGPAPVPAKKSNTLLKVIVVVVLLVCVGSALALAGMWYAAQKIKQKASEAISQATGDSTGRSSGMGPVVGAIGGLAKSVADNGDSPAEFKGDPCRFLSTQEVTQAVGTTVIRAEGHDGECSYIAKGDPADMTTKHLTSMTEGLRGTTLDPKSKSMIEGFAGGLFKQQESQDKDLSAAAAKGEVPVLALDFQVGNAEATMKLNRASFHYISPGAASADRDGTGDLDGIGDDAYVAGAGMLMVRKGDTIARFTYVSCPCNTGNIKPLAKLVASRM